MTIVTESPYTLSGKGEAWRRQEALVQLALLLSTRGHNFLTSLVYCLVGKQTKEAQNALGHARTCSE